MHMCVNNLPRVALDSRVAGIQTHDLLIASPAAYCYATKPLCHYKRMVWYGILEFNVPLDTV